MAVRSARRRPRRARRGALEAGRHRDVTEQVVDLEARLRASRAAAERLQQLITRAATVAEVVGVEAGLARRTAEVESLEGRLRVLRDKIACRRWP